MSSIARAAEIGAHRDTGTLRDVEHVEVLMQENRSFDQYFGTLRGVRGFGDPRPVTLPSGKSVWHQSDGTRDILPFRPDVEDLGMKFIKDTAHNWNDTHAAWNQGHWDKWVVAKSPTTMVHFDRQDVPFHFALADAFTICDDYHCSFLGSTDPNRYYMWTGYTGNDGKGGGPVLGNNEAGYSWTTYPELLEKAGISWKVYQDIGDGLDAAGSWGWTTDPYIGNYGDNALLYFNQYRSATPGTPLYDKARTGTNAKQGQGFFDILKADVKADRLPQVSWVVSPEVYTEHPDWPANTGAWYTANVLDALTANPDVWSRTALFVTYDENSGYFDHIVPPYPPSSGAHGKSTVDVAGDLWPGGSLGAVAGPYGLGARVPMMVVSPWSKGGWVCSEVFDHTSIIRFLEQRFGVHEPNISPWRRAICGDLTSAFDFARTDGDFPTLPDTSGYTLPHGTPASTWVPPVPSNPTMPTQEQGLRAARPLPYDLAADATLRGGGLTIAFASHGKLGASFYVTSMSNSSGPWTYAVEAGRDLSDTLSLAAGGATAYEFSVYGPNGFMRQFRGGAANAGPEVTARHDGRGQQVHLVLTNNGTATAQLTLTNAYGGGQQKDQELRAGARITEVVDLRDSNGWYDISIVSDQDGAFLRRLSGHVETGRPSTSDPANITG
jgi:phospholipase C